MANSEQKRNGSEWTCCMRKERVMEDKFTLDVGLALDLKMAFRRNGWSEAEIKKLTEGDALRNVRGVLLGHAEIKPIEHLIDCDANPFIPAGWSVEEHKKGGKFVWGKTRIDLFLARQQMNGVIVGHDLRKKLEGKPVLNANVLDFLLANPHLIPEDWKGKAVFFWGTVYRSRDGHLYVRFLCWDGGRWHWHFNYLALVWFVNDPAACAS